MKIFRWLLSHSLLILVIVAVIYSYMFWGNLAGEDTPAGKAIAYLSNEFVEVEEFVNAVKAKQSQRSGKQLSEGDEQASVVAEPVDDKLVIATGSSGNEGNSTLSVSGAESNNIEVSSRDIVQQAEVSSRDIEQQVEVSSRDIEQQAEVSSRDIEQQVEVSSRDIEQQVEVSSRDIEQQVEVSSRDIEQQAEVHNRSIEQQPVSISYSHNQMQVTQNSAGVIETERFHDDKPAMVNNVIKQNNKPLLTDRQANTSLNKTQSAANSVAASDSKGVFVTGEIEEQLSDVDRQGKVKTETPESDTIAVIEAERFHNDKPAMVNNDIKQNKDSLLTDRQVNASLNKTPSVANSVAASDSKGVFVTREIEKQLSNVNQQGKVKTETPQSDAIKDVWITARKSFYQRKYELSELSYQKVIDNTDDNFDAYGELGNVYFNQGKNKQAASAYFEAAAILVRKGQVQRARSLMGLLRHLDKSKADELQQLIDLTLS